MVERVDPGGGRVGDVEEAEMRVLPCEDEEGVIRRTRAGGGATVREVGPVAGVLGGVVVGIDLVISDD
mgnify:CR=1 FL=1